MAIKDTTTSKNCPAKRRAVARAVKAEPKTPDDIRAAAWYLICFSSPKTFTVKTLANTVLTVAEAAHVPRAMRIMRRFVNQLVAAGHVRALGHRLEGYQLFLMPSLPRGTTSTTLPKLSANK